MITASITPMLLSLQVCILPFPHHSMLLLSNQLLEAKAVTSNRLRVFLINTTNDSADNDYPSKYGIELIVEKR